MAKVIMKQETLIKPTPEQIAKDKIRLADLTIEYINLEQEKKAADADYAERLGELWEEICAIKAGMEQ